MAKHYFAVCCHFAVCFLVTDGKDILCRLLADDKEVEDDKSFDSSSDIAPSEVTDNVGDERGDAFRGIPKLSCLDIP